MPVMLLKVATFTWYPAVRSGTILFLANDIFSLLASACCRYGSSCGWLCCSFSRVCFMERCTVLALAVPEISMLNRNAHEIDLRLLEYPDLPATNMTRYDFDCAMLLSNDHLPPPLINKKMLPSNIAQSVLLP